MPPATRASIRWLGRLPIVLLLVFSVWLQLAGVERTVINTPLRSDSGEYFSYAFNLHEHGVYSSHPWWIEPDPPVVADSIRPPGYPLFLLAVGRPVPTNEYLHRVEVVQAFIAVLSVWLVYLIGRRFLPRGWALAPAVFTAASPQLATLSTNILSETLFTCLLLAAVLATIGALQAGTATGRRMFLAGLAWGAASLVRSTTELLPPMLFALVVLLPGLRALRRPALLGMLGFALVLAPWHARNALGDVSSPKSSLMVKALAHGSYPGFMYENRPETFGFPYRFDPDADRIARDLPSVLHHIAGRFRERPAEYARWYLLAKPGYFLAWGHIQGLDIYVLPVFRSPWADDQRFIVLRGVALLFHWPLMLLGLAGGALLLRPNGAGPAGPDRRAALIVALVVGYAIAFHMVVAPFPRYGVPFRPLIYLLAMLPLLSLWRRLVPGARPGLTQIVTS